ncbi:MAG: DEAD/DEAH box helicase family protein [Deltaproteobacteria bacterium]|nr:DEAD/DEAH box helicase family protein [Deltaproteobacteria bacterium]
MDFEVPQPILNSPFGEPRHYWRIVEGRSPERVEGRRPPIYFYRPPGRDASAGRGGSTGTAIEMKLVSRIRARLAAWREEGYPGVSRTTLELLRYWRREGREFRLFFAQLEAAEAVLFLTEARSDFLQGVEVPPDMPPDGHEPGTAGFRRYACKMATGSGKTMVMGMLAAWSILNKVNDRADARFSDVVLVVCPNVTIRNRLQELRPETGEASLYRRRDLVPPHLMPDLNRGRVLVTNWHVFEPQPVQVGGVAAKVAKAGVERRQREVITIGPKTTTARGRRYLTVEDFERQVAAGMLAVVDEERDVAGSLHRVTVDSVRYVESDASVVARVLGREVGGKQNVLVFNDEAHHAYRIRRDEPEGPDEADLFGDEGETADFVAEATVWVDGLDRIHRLRGINFCVDLSATPYYLARVGQDTNRTFPWVVSDFGLIDAIESGLVKIPQLAVRDTTGAQIPGYFNIWRWILPQLSPAERGGTKSGAKPEAVLKWAATPIAMLGGLWDELRAHWAATRSEGGTPPVFILVCKDTRLASVVFDWLANDQPPHGIPRSGLDELKNTNGSVRTIRVDSKVVSETDTEQAKSDETAWMRTTLDTVGRAKWPTDLLDRPIRPDGFEALAARLDRPLHPPGRDIRCIVSVGMLTEGWDCNTVTHIVGLRPFMSQLLCEQVVGRGLRRTSYEVGADGLLTEEVAKVFGVPFEVIPFKENPHGKAPPPELRHHVRALPERAGLRIDFPRVEGYRQAIRDRVVVDWDAIAPVTLDPFRIPPEVEMKAGLPTNQGRHGLTGPGRLERVDLSPYRAGRRVQELEFELARDLTAQFATRTGCQVPRHRLFPQMRTVVHRFLGECVRPIEPACTLDAFLSPYYGWVMERLVEAIRPDTNAGEAPELPRYETHRPSGSTADVSFWTTRDVREVVHSHLNCAVMDTTRWEQSASYLIDSSPLVESFAKNAGLGLAIPYLHDDQSHDYVPDFIVRLRGDPQVHLILETKGYDQRAEIKEQAAKRWVRAVNADGQYGTWRYAVARRIGDIPVLLREASSAPV